MTTKRYLDEDGLVALWEKIKSADDEVRSQLQESIDTVSNKVDALDSSLSNLDTTVEEIKERLDNLEIPDPDGRLESVTIVEASAENPIEGNTEGKFFKFEWTTGQIAYLSVADLGITGNVDLSELISRIEDVEKSSAKVEGFDDRISDIEVDFSDIQGEFESLGLTVEELDATVKGFEGRISALENSQEVSISLGDLTYSEGKFSASSGVAADAESVAISLNKFVDEFKPSSADDYYSKEESDERFVSHDEMITIEEVEQMVRDVNADGKYDGNY